MTAESFLIWFRKFVEFSKATKDFPVLLILDGYSTHTKSLEVIDYARESGVSLLCLPPHCSHRLQPLDVSFMKPLSLHYSDELGKWLRGNPGKVVTLFQISTLFGSAFIQSATMKTAINGFQATGIWPTDPSIFTDAEFLPADTTDIRSGTSEEMIATGPEQLELPLPSTPLKKNIPIRLNKYDKADEVAANSNDDQPSMEVRFNESHYSWVLLEDNTQKDLFISCFA
ncbi:DDE superfamily endonuclease [Popillia japonica]|uniref:DDE superfamily endonuclease n=1 Tax=Popillia japonica TaxID=7064 RepID=A0AAW1LYW5_POPJA